MYFLKDSRDYSTIFDKKDAESQESLSGMTMVHETRTEAEVFRDRIDQDLVAFGNFSAHDIITHSVYQDEFTHLEPGLFEQK